jgi:two-component system sensor histidine kinase KdpD
MDQDMSHTLRAPDTHAPNRTPGHDLALRQLEAALRGVIETVDDAVFVCDPGGRVTLANAAAMGLFSDRAVATFDDLLARVEPAGEAADPGRPFEARLRDQPSRWVEVRIVNLGESRPAQEHTTVQRAGGRIVVLRDVTVARRERLIREAFLGMLSHELRTPITTVYAGSKVLARADRLPAGVRRELAADVASEAERLYKLVEDLLALARIERGQLDLVREPVLLQRVVSSVLRMERSQWPRVDIACTAEPGLVAAAGDQRYLEQVVRNLIANAARHSKAGGRVDVAVDGQGDEVRVRVVGGSGDQLGPVVRDAPFDVAERGSEVPADAAGSGIGLFVCRRLVAAMGGRIWSSWSPEGRSEVGFALPSYRDDDRRLT